MNPLPLAFLVAALAAAPCAMATPSSASSAPSALMRAAYGDVRVCADAPVDVDVQRPFIAGARWRWARSATARRAGEPGARVQIEALDVVRMDDAHLALVTLAYP